MLLSVTLTPVVTFDGTNGSGPRSLVADSAGNLFGITAATVPNGKVGPGTVFEVPAGTSSLDIIATLPDSRALGLSVIVDSAGNLYGTTNNDGDNAQGRLFEIAHGTTTVTTLASFGVPPIGIQNLGAKVTSIDSAGDLFGTDGQGSVFELPHGSHTFTAITPEGNLFKNPISLAMASDGTLFCTTQYGGADRQGSIFQVLPGATTATTIASFDGATTGSDPLGVLIDGNGNLFGVTGSGGANGFGTYFELPSGASTINVITTFAGTAGPIGTFAAGPGALDPSGNFYDLTVQDGANGNGTLFEIPSGSSTPVDLHDFTSDEITSRGDGVLIVSASQVPRPSYT